LRISDGVAVSGEVISCLYDHTHWSWSSSKPARRLAGSLLLPPPLPIYSSGFGIDLGTANSVVCRSTGEVLLNQPSVMAIRQNGSPKVVRIGDEARELIGRAPAGLITIRPIRDGVVTDLQHARAFIVALLNRAVSSSWQRLRPRAVVGVPVGATALERRALIAAVQEAGMARVDLLPEPIAGAVGCGVDPLEARAHMVIDVGGGTAEVTAFGFGGVLASNSCRIAGDEMTAALHDHVRRHYGIAIGEITAEDVKLRLREVAMTGEPLVVAGVDTSTGRGQSVIVDPQELNEALQPTLDGIFSTLGTCLDDLPPRTVGDILNDGILAFGGGSLLMGFGQRLEEEFGFGVRHAERPMTCVAEGAAAALQQPLVLAAFGDR
jgi:rod shape-determining protein MreB